MTRRSVENSPIMTKNVMFRNKFQSIIFGDVMIWNGNNWILIKKCLIYLFILIIETGKRNMQKFSSFSKK